MKIATNDKSNKRPPNVEFFERQASSQSTTSLYSYLADKNLLNQKLILQCVGNSLYGGPYSDSSFVSCTYVVVENNVGQGYKQDGTAIGTVRWFYTTGSIYIVKLT